MSNISHREQCPDCMDSKQDNLVIYDDGSSYCFACGEIKDKTEESKAPKDGLLSGNPSDLPTRGITKETCRKYGYHTGKYTGRLGSGFKKDAYVHIANYCDISGTPVAQKIRDRDKNITCLGDSSGKLLYGQWLFEPSQYKELIIVEGEIDALTVYQVLGKKSCVVSVPDGAGSAVRSLKANMEWLLKWGSIVLAFDNDEQGRKAQDKAASLFDPTFVKLVAWTAKDPNELLVAGRGREIVEVLNNAKVIRPKSILQASEIMSSILTRPTMGVSWPWKTLTSATYGIQPNRIYTIGGGAGGGKTEFLINIVGHLINNENLRVGGLFLESSPEEIYLRMAGYKLGKRLHVPEAEWNEKEIKDTLDKYEDKLYLYSVARAGQEGSSWQEVKSKIQYMVKGLGLRYIILDHLTALACHMKDERKELDKCMAELGTLVHSLQCTVFLVSHLAKPKDDPGYEEGRIITANAFRGSQSIQYWSAFMLGIERNKMAENPHDRLLTKIRVLKDRYSGESDGLLMPLMYNTTTGKLEERIGQGEI